MSNFITVRDIGHFGRLGNQLFQIAAALGYSKMYDIPAKFPRWICNYDKIDFAHYFKNKLDETLNPSQISHVFNESDFAYIKLPRFNVPTNMHGYFQSCKYFEHCDSDIRHYFEPADFLVNDINTKYGDVLSGNTCSIHIRRGDYVGSAVHDVCTMQYYNTCIDRMKKDGITKFIIFSDDIAWCKSKFTDGDFNFIEGNNVIFDLIAMSMCNHNIIANSSYSWWASYLNKNPSKTVYGPSDWFGHGSNIINFETIYRKDIIKINTKQ